MPSILRIILAIALTAVTYYLFTSQLDLVLSTSATATLFAILVLACLLSPLIEFGNANTANATANKPKAKNTQKKPRAKAAPQNNAATEIGEVKWFNVSKGYGFITRDNGDDIFVHYRSIIGEGRRNLREGQEVEFIAGQGDKGPQAESVQVLD